VTKFRTEREAKEYLAGRIVEEAKYEGTPLTEVERKMLYFTETGWTLPDMMAVNKEFERDYDEDGYEQKIGGLAAKIQDRDDAVLKLSEGDHYLLILINTTPQNSDRGSPLWNRLRPWLPSLDSRARRDPHDAVRLVVVSVAFGAILLLGIFISALLRN
jgi:hypothetical protein